MGRPGSTHALGGNGGGGADGEQQQSFPPSFRIQRAPTYATASGSRRTKDRGTSAGGGGGGRGKLIHQVNIPYFDWIFVLIVCCVLKSDRMDIVSVTMSS